MKSLHTYYLEISKSALEHNLQFLKNYIGSGVQISSVVKGNALCHGREVFVPLAEHCGINHFSVFSADEALRVHNASTENSTVMVMGLINNEQLEWAIENNIEFFVFEQDRLGKNLSNRDIMLINGQRVSVVGAVNMNMISVDVTQINSVEKGDEVVLIGKQGDLEISVSSFSEFSEQVNYELLTRLPENLPRLIVD